MIPGEDIVAHRAELLHSPAVELSFLIDEPQPGNKAWWAAVRGAFARIKEIMEGEKDSPPTPSYRNNCRVCRYPIAKGDYVGASGGVQCFSFHRSCLDGLSPEARAEVNKLNSVYFPEDEK